MSQKFNRSITLTVFKESESQGISISDLRIAFEVTKDQLGYPNLAKIDVYNLNRNNQNRIKNESDKVLLNAGYADSDGLIFSGEIRNIEKLRRGVDLITRIWAASNQRGVANGFLNYTAGADTKVRSIIEAAAETFEDVVIGRIDELVGTNKIMGESLSGSSASILDRLATDYGFDWFVEDGKLNVLKPESTLNTQQTAVLISSTTGMIGVPTVTERGADVKTLLDHNIKIGKLVKIESQTNEVSLGSLFFRNVDRTLGEGFYKAIKIIHSGDTHGNLWQSAVEGLSL